MTAPTTGDLPRLLTADQVCEQFGTIGRHRLYQLARRGQIPSIKLGRAYRFPLSGLMAWIASGGTTGNAAAALKPTKLGLSRHVDTPLRPTEEPD
jgi:excisionase family DNA binding protein